MNALYEKNFRELAVYMVKRTMMLVAKLIGFKSFCFLLATYLLFRGVIDQYVWLYAMIIVVCNTSGLRIADAWTAGRVFGYGNGAFFGPDGAGGTGACRSGPGAGAFFRDRSFDVSDETNSEVNDDEIEKSMDGFDTAVRSAAGSRTGVRTAVGQGKRRIRALLGDGRSEPPKNEKDF